MSWKHVDTIFSCLFQGIWKCLKSLKIKFERVYLNDDHHAIYIDNNEGLKVCEAKILGKKKTNIHQLHRSEIFISVEN